MQTWSQGSAVTAGNYELGRDADGTNQMHFNVPTGTTYEFSINDVSQIMGLPGAWRFVTGAAVTAAQYEIGRDADATNQMHFNVPTSATFEWSVNDVAQMTLSATAVDFLDNSVTTTGGGSLTGTWSNLGTVTTVDINGGTLDGVTIGGASAAAATVTTLSMNNLTSWSAGAAITAASYQVGRDADGTNQMHFNIPTGASFEWSVNDTAELVLNATNLGPGANDGLALGVSGMGFSDLFLAEGAVINFDEADYTITHALGALTLTSDATVAGAVALTITPGAHTTMIANTADFVVSSHTDTITAGYTAQTFNRFDQPTISAASVLTVTTATTLSVLAPTQAASAIITNTVGLSVGNATTTPVIANAATSTYTAIQSGTQSLTLAGTTQITSACFAAGYRVGIITINQSGGAVTVDNAASIYVEGPPAAGASVTLTNPYALFVDGGTSRFDGDIHLPTVGSIINFASSDVTITHASNTLTFAGATKSATTGYVFNTGLVQATAGLSTFRAVNDITTGAVPTDAELDTAFGDPTTLPSGFIGMIDDNDAGTTNVLCWTSGTAGEWFFVSGTKAT